MTISSPEEQAIRSLWAAEDAAWESAQIEREMERRERADAIIAARGKLHDLLCLPKHEAGDVARQWAQEAYDLLAEAAI